MSESSLSLLSHIYYVIGNVDSTPELSLEPIHSSLDTSSPAFSLDNPQMVSSARLRFKSILYIVLASFS